MLKRILPCLSARITQTPGRESRVRALLGMNARVRPRSTGEKSFTGALTFCLALGLAHGAEVIPQTQEASVPRPIAGIVARPGTGDDVVIRGHVQEKTGESTYAIVDSSGRIGIRVADALLTGGIVLLPGTPVEVRGRVSASPGRTVEVEAREVRVLRGAEAPLGGGGVKIR